MFNTNLINGSALFMKKIFDTELFLESLPLMGKGMLGIFIVTAVIVAVVYLLNILTKPKK